jgi:hypothetical protein
MLAQLNDQPFGIPWSIPQAPFSVTGDVLWSIASSKLGALPESFQEILLVYRKIERGLLFRRFTVVPKEGHGLLFN